MSGARKPGAQVVGTQRAEHVVQRPSWPSLGLRAPAGWPWPRLLTLPLCCPCPRAAPQLPMGSRPQPGRKLKLSDRSRVYTAGSLVVPASRCSLVLAAWSSLQGRAWARARFGLAVWPALVGAGGARAIRPGPSWWGRNRSTKLWRPKAPMAELSGSVSRWAVGPLAGCMRGARRREAAACESPLRSSPCCRCHAAVAMLPRQVSKAPSRPLPAPLGG